MFFISLLDINECQLEVDECNQVCINQSPGYVCACDIGFDLHIDDNVTCVGKDIFFLLFLSLFDMCGAAH